MSPLWLRHVQRLMLLGDDAAMYARFVLSIKGALFSFLIKIIPASSVLELQGTSETTPKMPTHAHYLLWLLHIHQK